MPVGGRPRLSHAHERLCCCVLRAGRGGRVAHLCLTRLCFAASFSYAVVLPRLFVGRSGVVCCLCCVRQALRNSSALSTEKFNAAGDTRVSRWPSQSSFVLTCVGMVCVRMLGVWG